MKDVVWCFKIPDFMWLKHLFLKDHDHFLLNVDIYAQFSVAVVVSSMEPIHLASIRWEQCSPERWQWQVALWQLGEGLLLSWGRCGGICSSTFVAVSWYPAQHVMLYRASMLCNMAVGRYFHVISIEFTQV